MLQLEKIRLIDFKNFNNFSYDFGSKITLIFGANGAGKTNILEAISLLNNSKGFRKSDIINIARLGGSNSWAIQARINCSDCNFLISSGYIGLKSGKVTAEDKTNARHSYRTNDVAKKIFKIDGKIQRNDKNIEKLLSIISLTPSDLGILLSSNQIKRNLIDEWTSKLIPNHTKLVSEFKKLTSSRLRILNDFGYDISWLGSTERKCSELGYLVSCNRYKSAKQLNEQLGRANYFDLKSFFSPNFCYKDSFTKVIESNDPKQAVNEICALYNSSRDWDAKTKRNSIGPSRATFEVRDRNTNSSAEQLSFGQQKLLVYSLFLSVCELITSACNRKPIILIDEIFSHLDEFNQRKLFSFIEESDFQCIATNIGLNNFDMLEQIKYSSEISVLNI